MLKYLIKGLMAGMAIKLLNNWRRLSVQLLRIEAAKCYIHGVQMVRWSAIGLLRMGLIVGLMGVGVLLLHAGLFVLLPWTLQSKAILGIALGLAYVVGGGIALRAGLDEKAWMAKSGAARMLEEATDPAGKE